MITDDSKLSEVACGSSPENRSIQDRSGQVRTGQVIPLPGNCIPNIEGVASSGSHQHLGFKKGMALVSLNINGLRSHLDEVQLLMKELGIHIFALNETKLDPDYPRRLTKVNGYQQERLGRTSVGGGVSIYIRDCIKYKPRPDTPSNGLELICIEIEPPKSKSFLVLVWYRPPSDPVGSFDKLERVFLFWTRRVKKLSS